MSPSSLPPLVIMSMHTKRAQRQAPTAGLPQLTWSSSTAAMRFMLLLQTGM